ncbi:MAG TPA: STAS domain-containing protein [Trebonia sp.]|nr:STAS domain-containing protein [Trebonia sp.]
MLSAVPSGGRGTSRVRRRGPPSAWKGNVVVSRERFPVRWSRQTAVITLSGEIDLTIADEAGAALLAALSQGPTTLIVDMSQATFCDSAGVNALVRAARRATAGNVELRIVAAAAPVLRVFSLVGIDRVLEVHPSVAAALAAGADGQATAMENRTTTPLEPDSTET